MAKKDDFLWNVYNTVNCWIERADAKASAILAGCGVYAGFVVVNLEKIIPQITKDTCSVIFSGLAIISLLASIFFACRCTFPRLRVGEAKSLIYFNHIAQYAASSFKQKIEQLISNKNTNRELTNQIWANSKVASKKYLDVAISIRLFFLSIVFSLIPLIVYVRSLLNVQ